MGVPVITKSGSSYVSRMSTAVLRGAHLDDWCVDGDEAYIELALQHAENLHELRQSRENWRNHVKLSPLGDAADLMSHLVERFRMLRSKAF